jgi:repressor LexA
VRLWKFFNLLLTGERMGSIVKGNREVPRRGDRTVKKALTARQKEILDFIRSRVTDRGHPPTIREIGDRFGITSTNGVRTHLTALIRKGFIRKQNYISRGIELVTNVARDIARVPLVGSVPAGSPIDAVENIENEFALDPSFLPRGNAFSLRVSGDSMRNAGILDGDIVIVKKQATADRGDIVVAILNGEATVKRYFPGAKQVRLQPENEDFDPILIDKKSGELRIAGKVVGLLRRFG